MQESITTVELDSFTKERPRTNFKTRAIYTPASTLSRERQIAQEFRLQNRKWEITNKPIKINIVAYVNIPISANKTQKKLMEEDKIKPVKKPDVDNVAKLVLDALNGVAYEDDLQVISLQVEKRYWTVEKAITKKKFLKILIEEEE